MASFGLSWPLTIRHLLGVASHLLFYGVIFVCVICLDGNSFFKNHKEAQSWFFKMSGVLNSSTFYFLRDMLSSTGRGSLGTHSKLVFGCWRIFDTNTQIHRFIPFSSLFVVALKGFFLSPFLVHTYMYIWSFFC